MPIVFYPKEVRPSTLKVSADGSYGFHANVMMVRRDPGSEALSHELVWWLKGHKLFYSNSDLTVQIGVGPREADVVINYVDTVAEVGWLADHPLRGRLWRR